MAYTPQRKPKRLILKGVAAPKTATLLRTGEPLEVAAGDGTVTIVIPADKTTKLVDVVKLHWSSEPASFPPHNTPTDGGS